MGSLSFLTFAVVLTIASATPHLVVYSTSAHFQCRITAGNPCDAEHPSAVSAHLLPTLLRHLMNAEKAVKDTADTTLPLADLATATPAQVVVLVHSVYAPDSASLIHRVADAVPSDTATSFRAPMVGTVAKDTLVGHQVPSVANFAALISGEKENSIIENAPSVVVVPAPTKSDLADLFVILRSAAARVHNLAVIFTVHQDAGADQENPADPPEADAPAAGDSDTQDTNDTSSSQNEKTMNPPEISAPQLTGLLVAILFLIIFIPGFMCLWRIQTPQTFAILDSNDMKKKIQ